MHLQESGEMYLETIYVLSKKMSIVRSIDICEYMGYSKPSVSRAIHLLKSGGFVLIERDGSLTLTEIGSELAEKILERHNVISQFLGKLGVEKDTADRDACRIEHIISEESFNAIKAFCKEK